MACKCTQTTSNATGGGAITSPLSACSYTLWVNQISGCTGSALDVHFGNPGANILFNLGIDGIVAGPGTPGYTTQAYGTNNVSIDNPNPLHRFSIGNQGNIDVEEYIHFGDGAFTGNTGNDKTGTKGDVYLGYKAGYTRTTNFNSEYNTVVGFGSLGSTGVLNAAHNNVAVGSGTMLNATSAKNNVMVGTSAGNALTIGQRNVYLGYGQGKLETTTSDELRIGNKTQTAGGSARPLIQGNFATSATTLWGSARITDLPTTSLDSFVTIGTGPINGGYLTTSNYGLNNTGVWTANTQDCSTSNGCDCTSPDCDCGYYDGTGANGYRSVSISGGTNHTATDTDWAGTRVGIGTRFPEVPLHIKAPYGYLKVQSTVGGSYIESLTPNENAYIGVAAGNGVKSGSTTWRIHASNTPFNIRDWKVGANEQVGTGFTVQHRTQGNGVQIVTNPITVVGDYMSDPTKGLDGALVIRSGDGSGGSGGIGGNQNPSHGIGIFTTRPTKELTVIGAMSATGSIHSTDYIKFPNPALSTYIGYGISSASTTSTFNTFVGYQATTVSKTAASNNTGVGTYTQRDLETGSLNTSLGVSTLAANTSGNANVAIGSYALLVSEAVSNNIGIGHRALAGVVEGESNLAIGSNALFANLSTLNVAIGNSSGSEITTGHRNTVVGANTHRENQTGHGNSSLGHASLQGGGGSHSYNTSLGSGSMSGITTGGCNVAVGNNAGAGITTPGGKITTGSNNIMIGCEVDVKDGTVDGQLNIGNKIFGTGPYIGLLKQIPDKTLDVVGDIQLTGDIFANGNIIGDGVTNISGMNTVTANTFIGNLTGNVTGVASQASKIFIDNLETGDTECFIPFSTLGGADYRSLYEDSLFTYNTTSDTLSVANVTSTGTITAEQLTSTDDITAAGDISIVPIGSGYFKGLLEIPYTNAVYALDSGGVDRAVLTNLLPTGLILGNATSVTTKVFGINVELEGATKVTLTTPSTILTGSLTVAGDINANGNIVGDGATDLTSMSDGTFAGTVTAEQITSTDDMTFGDRLIMSNVATSYMIGNAGSSNNDVEIWSANDIELKAADDITLEATGRVEFTQFGADEPSCTIDLNDTPGAAFFQSYGTPGDFGTEVFGLLASTRRLYLMYQGEIPGPHNAVPSALQQTWISGNEFNGGEYDLTIGSTNDVIFSATSIGMGTTLPKTKLDVHHDPTGLANNTGGGEVITFGSAGTGYATGNLVQLRGVSNWVRADADNTTLQGNLMGIALGAAPSDGILLKGFYKINTADDVATWANGGQLYSSTVVGKITASIASHLTGDYVRVVGYMTTTTNVMYFDPESSFIVIT